jgi:hypothetical protein
VCNCREGDELFPGVRVDSSWLFIDTYACA